MSRIEDQANYYNNYHLRYRNTVAVVHVEDEDDRKFWETELTNVRPGTYHFVTQSKSNEGKVARGCEQCLKYKGYTNHRFFICIDSDLRLLCGEKELTPENYVAQTYTYSWENHACEAEALQNRFMRTVEGYGFNFVNFLNKLSAIVYRPLLYLVYYQTPDYNPRDRNREWNISKFNQCLPSQMKRRELENNGGAYLDKVKRLFDEALSKLSIPQDYHVEGLTAHNTYLHIQGHQLYNLITYMGRLLCRENGVAFKFEVLDKDLPVSGYKEIQDVQLDLRSILFKE